MPYVDLDPARPGRVVISTNYTDRHLIKQLPGSAYDGTAKMWHAPLSWGTCITLRGLFKNALTIGDSLREWAWTEHQQRVDPCTKLRLASDISDGIDVNLSVNDDLFPFQKIGAWFMATAGQGLLADEMGSGKTVQMIMALKILADVRHEEVFPALVVCPNGIKYVWEREFKRWWPGIRVKVIAGGAAGRRRALAEEADVYVINYDAVKLHSRLAPYGDIALRRCEVCEPKLCSETPQSRCEWCKRELNTAGYVTIIADEAHRIKSPHTKWTRAVWSIAHGKTVKYRFGLTGTPVAKNLGDLWSVMHMISPDEYPQKTKFIDRYVEKSYNFFGGMEILGIRAETRDEFFKIFDPRFRRLPKEVVLPQLPEKIYSTRLVEMPAKQERAYRQMEKYMAARLDEEILLAKNPMVKVGRLLQFACAYAEMDKDGNVTLTDPSCKIDALEDLIDEAAGAPMVVFSASKQLVNLAARRLDKIGFTSTDEPVLVTGDYSVEERQRRVDKFQAGKLPTLLCTVDAAGEGLTMTRANKLVFLNRHWAAHKNGQAEDRIHRIGSEVHASVEIIDIVAKDTWEDRQREILEGKLERLEEIVRDRETVMALLGIS